jgi:hypothetical protein
VPTTNSCPDAILTAIPWYPDGLTPEECGAVEAHAADCRGCRAELAFLRGDEEPAIEIPDSDQVYARVLERIGSSDEPEGVEGAAPRAHWLRTLSQRAAGPVSIAAGLMVALVSGMLTTGVIWAARVVPAYEVDSALSSTFTHDAQHLEIVFEDDATAGEIGEQLRAVRASIVAGPTPRGVYRLRLAPGVEPEVALEQLRAGEQGVVASAEPSRR